jgi:hypothetical protein
MPSFTTVFRAIVMLSAAIIIVEGWQLYGPSAQQMKSWTAGAVERVHLALSERPQLAPATSELASEPKAIEKLPAVSPSILAPSPGRFEATEFPAVPPILPQPVVMAGLAAEDLIQSPQGAGIDSERMPVLLARLEQLGAVDPQLAAWGSSGQLYRFCCRAALADMPTYTRHFESVAEEPLLAVKEVVAKVEAWRSEQPASGELR